MGDKDRWLSPLATRSKPAIAACAEPVDSMTNNAARKPQPQARLMTLLRLLTLRQLRFIGHDHCAGCLAAVAILPLGAEKVVEKTTASTAFFRLISGGFSSRTADRAGGN